MRRTRKENIFRWTFLLFGFCGLLGFYGYLIHEINTAKAEVNDLIKALDGLKTGNAELEERNRELYADFCQEAEWLQECQKRAQSFEKKDVIE
jgi:hypothetical protein